MGVTVLAAAATKPKNGRTAIGVPDNVAAEYAWATEGAAAPVSKLPLIVRAVVPTGVVDWEL
jgi:hypothetical protein